MGRTGSSDPVVVDLLGGQGTASVSTGVADTGVADRGASARAEALDAAVSLVVAATESGIGPRSINQMTADVIRSAQVIEAYLNGALSDDQSCP
jgi:hypothetical protein